MAEHSTNTAKVSNTKQQNTAKENTLSDAKDRAQLTATTAMSVVHVALLRSVLNSGRSNNKYYVPVLVLISVSLACQVIAGTLALLISHMKSYYQKYNEDSCTDFWSNVCCCRIVCRRKKQSTTTTTTDVPLSSIDVTNSDNDNAARIVPAASSNSAPREAKNPADKCCTCVCGRQMLNEDDMALMRKHSDLSEMLMNANIAAAEAKVKMEYYNARIQRLRADRQGSNDGNGVAEQDIQTEITECEEAIKDCDSKIRLNDIVQGQYDIVQDAVNDLRTNYVLKRVSFWQNALNYILYFIFIFNAFITGLGVSGNGLDN